MLMRCIACQNLVGKLGDMHECTDGQFKFALEVEGPQAQVSLPFQYQQALTPKDPWLDVQNQKPFLTYAPPKQRGGRFTVSGWLALALVALAAAEAGLIGHLYRHRTIEIAAPHTERLNAASRDVACGVLGNICWVSI